MISYHGSALPTLLDLADQGKAPSPTISAPRAVPDNATTEAEIFPRQQGIWGGALVCNRTGRAGVLGPG